MRRTAPTLQEAARRLLAHEAEASHLSEARAVLCACERICSYLSKLVGVAGFQALLSRSLALAKEEVRWLEEVHVRSDATLEGFEDAAMRQLPEEATRGGVAILAHLLELLTTFIGEALTLRLVKEVWPEGQLDDLNLSAKGTQ